jgi:hypothetical protein
MPQTQELFDSMTVKAGVNSTDLAATVEALQDCAQAVTACAAAMLTESDREQLTVAVGRDLDCADVVEATRRVLTRGTGPDGALLSAQLEACVLACERSYEQCSPHAHHHVHCRMCSEATRHCAEAARNILKALHSS